ncbi:hypothetical protein N752_27190 [Desulforamulus aquiferis]|nr:hypothetical protein [Desulforamulus aquiferis]RYD02139.1 hypothetical protein N752_27190 [Desulforamulus aquiferis]
MYIPIKKLVEFESSFKITSLEVETRDIGTTGRNVADFKTALSSIGQDPANYKIIDYNMERLLLEQKNLLRNFVVGMGAVWCFSVYSGEKQGVFIVSFA